MEQYKEKLLTFLKSSFNGIDHSKIQNGGIDCYDFTSFEQRLVETCAFTLLTGIAIFPRVIRTLNLPQEWEINSACRKRTSRAIIGARKFLLVFLSFVFGINVGFHILKEKWVLLLDPSHIITIMQIYLLSAEPSRACMAIFRIHMNLIHVTFFAAVQPAIDGQLPEEEVNIWVQHVFVTFVIPPYLIYTAGAFKCEPIRDCSWAFLTVLISGFYTFFMLQPVSMATLANINNVLCPSPSDPFYGPYYRCAEIGYQSLMILCFGKLHNIMVIALMKCRKMQTRKKDIYLVDDNTYLSLCGEEKDKLK